jgi:hypothetical protein
MADQRGLGRTRADRRFYLQGGMDDSLIGRMPLIPTSVPLSLRKSAEPSGLNSAFSEHLSQ